MIIDAEDLEPGSTLVGDVCVVGAGAAGIIIARELIGTGLDVVVLEGGKLELSEASQALYEGELGELAPFHDRAATVLDTSFDPLVWQSDDGVRARSTTGASGGDAFRVAPDPSQQVGSAEHAPGFRRQHRQEIELGGRQGDLVVAKRHPALVQPGWCRSAVCDRGETFVDDGHLVAVGAQAVGHRVRGGGFVVDEQDASAHAPPYG